MRSPARLLGGAVVASVAAVLVAVSASTPASAASVGVDVPGAATATHVESVLWSHARVDVARHDQTSTVRVRLVDIDGVCSVAVRVRSARSEIVRSLARTSGPAVDGTWSTSVLWHLADRGTWKVASVSVVDCVGHRSARSSPGGYGKSIKVYSSKPLTRLKLVVPPVSTPEAGEEGGTATVTASVGRKRVKGALIQLRGCDAAAPTQCRVLNHRSTSRTGVVRLDFSMKQDVTLQATYAGSAKRSRAASARHRVALRWHDITVPVTLTLDSAIAPEYHGLGTGTVRFARPFCDGTITLEGDLAFTVEFDGCTTQVSFGLNAFNNGAGPKTFRFRAVVVSEGQGDADTLRGTSNGVTYVVPDFTVFPSPSVVHA